MSCTSFRIGTLPSSGMNNWIHLRIKQHLKKMILVSYQTTGLTESWLLIGTPIERFIELIPELCRSGWTLNILNRDSVCIMCFRRERSRLCRRCPETLRPLSRARRCSPSCPWSLCSCRPSGSRPRTRKGGPITTTWRAACRSGSPRCGCPRCPRRPRASPRRTPPMTMRTMSPTPAKKTPMIR